MDILNEYRVGRGTFVGGNINPSNPPRGSVVDDSEIQDMLKVGIQQGDFGTPTGDHVYFVFTAPDVVVTHGGGDSQHDFAGYHQHFDDPALGSIYYAVIPHPIGNADFPGFNSFQQQTMTSSHELAEAVTDPDNRTGWGDDNTGFEIGDLAAGYYGVLDGYVVQAEYSKENDGPIIPADATPFYPDGAAAAPQAGQRQPGTDGGLSTSISNPVQPDARNALTSAMGSSQALPASYRSDPRQAKRQKDDYFAALAQQEQNGTDLLGWASGLENARRPKPAC
jgi:hypothetical protein